MVTPISWFLPWFLANLMNFWQLWLMLVPQYWAWISFLLLEATFLSILQTQSLHLKKQVLSISNQDPSLEDLQVLQAANIDMISYIGEQALWSWRGVIKNFARGGSLKKFFRVGLEGGSTKIFLCWFRRFRTKTGAGASRRKIFFLPEFFFLKKKPSPA